MDDKKLLKKLTKISIYIMKDGLFYHDHVHVMAVYSNVEKLLKFEKGNRLVLLTAALFHDAKRQRPNHSIEGAKYTKKLLANIEKFPHDLVDSVARVIASHSGSGKPKSREEKLFFDADKMDVFSDLGFVRTFMVYAKKGYSLEKSACDYIKFVDKIYKSLHTKTARKLIQKDYKKCRSYAIAISKKY